MKTQLSTREYERTFIESELAADIKVQLSSMEGDTMYATKTYYVPGRDSDISFTEKHFTYLSQHQSVKPHEYMANLRLKTKIRR